MIGNILLAVLLALLLALMVFLLIPVSLRVSYEEGRFTASVRYASKVFVLYPDEKKSAEDTETVKDTGKQEAKPQQKKVEPKPKPNWDQISYSLDVLPRVLCRALRGTMRRIRIRPLKFHLLVSLDDPADTAVLYGRLLGVCNVVLPALHRAVRIEEQDIELFPDFCGGRMDFILDAGIRIRPFDVLVVVFSAAGGLIGWFIGYKKRAEHTSPAQEIRKDTAA